MRRPVDAARIERFLAALGDRFRHPGRVYLVGGTTVVLKGLRAQTLDIDLTYEVAAAHLDEFFRIIRELKESLDVNVEEVSPRDFIPLPEGFESRALFVGRFGQVDVFHFDPYSTVLSKIERGTEKDFADCRVLLKAGVVDGPRLKECFDLIMRRYGRESLRQDEARFRRHFDVLRAEIEPPSASTIC